MIKLLNFKQFLVLIIFTRQYSAIHLLNLVPEARLVLAAGPLDGRGDVVGHVHREEGAHAGIAVGVCVLGEVAVEGGGPVVEPLPGHTDVLERLSFRY